MRETFDIPVEMIKPNRYQPRSDFNQDALMELAKSIIENGLIQPITVRKSGNEFEIITGERRYRAMRMAGFSTVPCMVSTADEIQMAELALIENLQREDLSAIEEANAYVKLLANSSLTQEKIASKMGKSQSAIANKIRLLQLPSEIQQAVSERVITERHGRALLNVVPEEQIDMFKKIVGMSLNVRQTEQWIDGKVKKREEEAKKRKTKGITRNLKIAINTIDAAIVMIEKTGVIVQKRVEENEKEIKIILHFPK
jgi:ParB family transcriptional regulator, chromosome partitioning protein